MNKRTLILATSALLTLMGISLGLVCLFVLVPLAELCADLYVPGRGALRDLIRHLEPQPISRLV